MMSEKRFILKTNPVSTNYPSGRIFDNKKQHSLYLNEIVDVLNEQQATIERLTKRRDRWRELSNSFSAYCNCYEKAIERAFEEKPYPTEDDINRIYAELEKELEYE